MESQLTPYAASSVPAAQAVLVLAPHPDDEVFGCGGALALHLQAGSRVHVVIATDGDAGGDAQVRRLESRAAAEVLGYGVPDFWGLPDRGVLYGEALVARIIRTLDECGAQVLYAPSLWEIHPDHRALALAAREAVRRQGHGVLMGYEIGAALRPNRLVDITPVLETKRSAMQCFGSQLALQAYDRHVEALNVFRSYTLPSAVQAAEAFEQADAPTLRARGQAFFESEYERQRDSRLMLLPEDADLVSILIRSMDRPELDRALSSIAAQTWPRIEVVVVNAKGTGHRALPEWCGRFPMRLVDSEAGPLHRSAAANRAIEAARGEFLMFLDDDDWLDAGHVAKLAQGLQERTDAVAAVTGAQGVDAEGRQVAVWKARPAGEHRLMLVNQMPIMSVLFRRDRLRGACFDEQMDVYEDWDFWLQLSEHGSFVDVPGISANYLIRHFDGSGVHQQEVAREGMARIRRKWRGRWPDAWFARVNQDLQAAEGRSEGLEAQEAQLREQLQLAHQTAAQARSLGEALQAAQAARERAERQQAAAEQQRDVAQQQRQVAEQQFQVAEHQRHVALQQRDTLQHERNLADQRSAVTQQSLDAVSAQLQAVLRSRSWRLGAPIRLAGHLIRRLLGR